MKTPSTNGQTTRHSLFTLCKDFNTLTTQVAVYLENVIFVHSCCMGLITHWQTVHILKEPYSQYLLLEHFIFSATTSR